MWQNYALTSRIHCRSKAHIVSKKVYKKISRQEETRFTRFKKAKKYQR